MLTKIESYLRSYLSFPDDRYYLPLALFAVLEHCWNECFDEVPYLSVSAMVKGAGKTRVLELLQFLAGDERAVLLDGSVTLAALYTETDEKKVVLIDESERLQNPHSTFRPILNGGYRSGQTLKRKIGGEVKSFSIFCPKVFAQIGDVHDSLRDRCIVVEMQRRMAGSRTEYVRQFAIEEGTEIAHEIEEALGARIGKIRDAYLNYHNLYPSLGFLPDRDRELWKPLFALCQVFAPDRIHDLERSAADIAALKTIPIRRFERLKSEEERVQKLEYAERLLRDSLVVTGERDRIASVGLVRGLREIPTSPWRTYEGEGINDISLASMLKLFGVEPKTIRFKPKSEPNSTAKGYLRTQLDAATMEVRNGNEEPSRNPVTPTDEIQKAVTALRAIPQSSHFEEGKIATKPNSNDVSEDAKVRRKLVPVVETAERYIRALEGLVHSSNVTLTEEQKKAVRKPIEEWRRILRYARGIQAEKTGKGVSVEAEPPTLKGVSL